MGIEPRDLGALEKAVNDAAGRASNLWISFVFFATLIAITTGTVTHKHLFLELPLKLPVLNVELPLMGYFFAVPLFFVVFHFYMLLQLDGLAAKIEDYNAVLREQHPHAADRRLLRQRLDSFIFAQVLVGARDRREGRIGRLNRAVAWITMVGLPIGTLLLLQLMFLPYHHQGMTWWHRICVVVDVGLVWFFWGRVGGLEDAAPAVEQRPPPVGNGALAAMRTIPILEHPAYRRSVGSGHEMGRRANGCPAPAPLLFSSRPSLPCTRPSGSLCNGLAFCCPDPIGWCWQIPTLGSKRSSSPLPRPEKRSRPPPRTRLPIRRSRRRRRSRCRCVVAICPTPTSSAPTFGRSTYGARTCEGSTCMGRSCRTRISARRSCQGATLFLGAAAGCGPQPGAAAGREPPRGAAAGCEPQRAQLQGRRGHSGREPHRGAAAGREPHRGAAAGCGPLEAQLQGADLSRAQLQGANLSWAQLQGADLTEAQLQGADLSRAQLQGANLSGRSCRAPTSARAQLQGAEPRSSGAAAGRGPL